MSARDRVGASANACSDFRERGAPLSEETLLLWVVVGLGAILVVTLVVLQVLYLWLRRMERDAVALWESRKEEESVDAGSDEGLLTPSETARGG